MKNKNEKLPPECDLLCEWRHCFSKGFDRGIFVPGKGYSHYFDKPKLICTFRMLNGCPTYQNTPMRVLPDFKKMINDILSRKRKPNFKYFLSLIKLISEYFRGEK